jgi:2-dehydro-3-deoxygluconokinase
VAVDLLCMGEPMLEFNLQPVKADGRRLYLEGHGGDTSNAAIAAARQGAHVGYISAVGADPAGDSFFALWEREGVDASTVLRSATRPTAVYVVSHGPDGHSFHYFRAGSAASQFAPADVPEAAIAGARMLFASGISQAISDVAADAVFRAMDVARDHDVAIAYDTNYRPRLWPPARAAAVIHAAIARTDYALPGIDDARALTGLDEPHHIADFYLGLGPRVVVLKMGAEGAYVATRDEHARVPPHQVKAVDATGAGDTFCGCFLARILAGDAPFAAARYATVASALKCTGYGAIAAIPRPEDVWRVLGRA